MNLLDENTLLVLVESSPTLGMVTSRRQKLPVEAPIQITQVMRAP